MRSVGSGDDGRDFGVGACVVSALVGEEVGW